MGDSIVSVAGSHETELIILFHDPLHPCFVTVFEVGEVGSRSNFLPSNLLNCSGNSNKKQNYQYCFRTITRKKWRNPRKTGALLAAMLAAAITTSTQAYAQDRFTGADFLTWDEEAQVSYISTSIVMASIIASQVREGFASCIGNWYLADQETKSERNLEMIAVIEDFPDHHPGGMLLAMVQRECGAFPADR